MKLSPKDSLLNFCFCLFFLAITFWALWAEFDRPWKDYQNSFNKLDAELTAAELEKLKASPQSDEELQRITLLEKRQENIAKRGTEIQQLWLTDFNTTDRCMTCHQGVEQQLFAEAEQPYTLHPGKHLDPNRHPVEKFGCVVCHSGQGVALEVHDAHGEAHNWFHPLLEGQFAEASCTTCHPQQGNVAAGAVLKDAPQFSMGRKLYMENNCLGCHVLDGFERPKNIGPKLTKINSKTDAQWMKYWINKPKSYLPKTTMPNFELPDDEIEAMVTYLLDLGEAGSAWPPMTSQSVKTKDVQLGKQTFSDLGCLGCHTIDKQGGDFGPDLSRVGEKASASWLSDWVKDPKKYWPDTAMPQLRVEDEELKVLVAYLSTQKSDTPLVRERETKQSGINELLNKGRLLVKDKGCTGCHEIGKFPLGYNAPEHDGIGAKREDELVFGNTEIPRTLRAWLKTKVMNPRAFSTKEIPTLMPNFEFDKDKAQALVTFLLSLTERSVSQKYVKPLHDPQSAKTKGELLIERHNCLGCHKIGAQGGDIGPDLSFEGERVNPEWLVDFIQTPFKIRPKGLLPTRMPTFNFSPSEAESLTAYFADREEAPYPYSRSETTPFPEKDRKEAWRLYWQVFSCQSCHTWNGVGGIVGPDQSDISNRLRKEWIAKWLKNPQKYIADVRMPNFELYPDEAELLNNLLQSFNEIPPAVWDQIRKRWDDELLAKEAAKMGSGK